MLGKFHSVAGAVASYRYSIGKVNLMEPSESIFDVIYKPDSDHCKSDSLVLVDIGKQLERVSVMV